MILVAGGTGTLGRAVIARLKASGQKVRVLTRDAAHADGLPSDVSVGDVRDPATLAAAVDGCSTLVSAMHGFLGGRGAGPELIDDRGNANLVRAAVDAGIPHFVMLSVLDARPDHPMSLHRAKYAAEQHLYASGVAWTVLRPSSYVETWIGIVGGRLASGGPGLVFGRGANPINFVAAGDVAALAERAITDSDLRGEAIDVPGPDNLTMVEFARLLGATKIRHVPRGLLRVISVAAAPANPAFARQASAALIMDTTDMTADAAPLHQRFPHLTWHTAADIVQYQRS